MGSHRQHSHDTEVFSIPMSQYSPFFFVLGHTRSHIMGKKYELDLLRQRNIPKFNVQGFDYKLKIDLHDRNRPYSELLLTLHSVIEGMNTSFC